MKVSELIDILKAFPPDRPVMVAGFDESGYERLEVVGTVEIKQVRKHRAHLPMFVDANERDEDIGGGPFLAAYLDFSGKFYDHLIEPTFIFTDEDDGNNESLRTS